VGWKFTTGDHVRHTTLPGVWRVVSPGSEAGTYVVTGDPSDDVTSALTSIAYRGRVILPTQELTAVTIHQEKLT
jgi:hypothetical protein